MSENWWRAKNSAVNNRKLQKLSGDLFKAWFNVNCLASANDGVVPPLEDVSFALRLSDQKAAAVLTQLTTAKLLDRQQDGTFVPHDWNQHQFKTDKTDPTAAARAKAYRDRKRDERDASRVTDSDGTVTDKRPEAEQKAETDSEQSRADASAPIDEDLKRKVAALQAGVSAHFVSRGQTIPNLDRCLLWLTQGYGPGTVLAAVEVVLKRGKAISTLDYFDGAVRDQHAKAPQTALQVVSSKVWVDEGTPEWATHQAIAHERTGRGTQVCDHKDENGRITGRRGWYFASQWAEGFNDFGERIAPSSDDEAAA